MLDPAGAPVQGAHSIMPKMGLYVSARHCGQAVAPATEENVPGEQKEQVDAPGVELKVPGGQERVAAAAGPAL